MSAQPRATDPFPCDDQAPPRAEPWRLKLPDGAYSSRASVTHLAARALSSPGRAVWGHEGRGPGFFDTLGFVRACVQAGRDLDLATGQVVAAPALTDIVGYQAGQLSGGRLARLAEEWGLVETRETPLPGDVSVWHGKDGGRMGVVLGLDFTTAWVAAPAGVCIGVILGVSRFRWPPRFGPGGAPPRTDPRPPPAAMAKARRKAAA